MYDSEKEIAWYLPKSSLSSTCKNRTSRLAIFKDSQLTQLKLAKPGSGGLEANHALISNLQLQTKKADSQSAMGCRMETIGTLIKAVWQALDDIGTGLSPIQKEFTGAHEGPPKYIYEVDYLDTVDMGEDKKTKRFAISQPWAYLTKDYPTAIFCSAIEHPVVPDIPGFVCRAWQVAPAMENYLVVTSSVLQHFLREGRKGFRENFEWDFDSELIHDHRSDRKSAVYWQWHVQCLRKVKKLQPNDGLLKLVA